MKTTKAKILLSVSVWIAVVMALGRAVADNSATISTPDKNYTGTVTAVDSKGHVLSVKGWTTFTKTFNLGDSCAYAQLDKNNSTLNDLRPGEKVTVSYRSAQGMPIADRIEQQPMSFEGMVKTIDYDKHTLVLHQTALDKELQLPAGCKIMLHDGKSGDLASIKVGDHVTAIYETPDDQPTVRQINQTSRVFTGTLTAIDLNDKTVKAAAALSSKKFILADNCAIVINDNLGGKLDELKPDEKLVFSYDEINGVNVVNRIAPAGASPNSVATYNPSPVSPVAGY